MARKKTTKANDPDTRDVGEVYALLMLVTSNDEPLPDGVPTCPMWLRARAKAAYSTFARALSDSGDASHADYALLAIWCEKYDDFVEAQEDMRVNGKTQKAPNSNYEQVRPQYTIAESSLGSMIKIAKEIGLTRRSRAAIHGNSEPTGGDDSGFGEWEKRGKH